MKKSKKPNEIFVPKFGTYIQKYGMPVQNF